MADPRNPNRPPPGRSGTHVETAREARQGPLGRPVLYVLVGGLILAGLFLLATQIWSGAEDIPPAPSEASVALPAAP